MSLYKNPDLKREASSSDAALKKNEAIGRDPFRRDYARLIHSNAFRRLVGKTQLFPGIESDYFRNRLTHSLEVAQVAKTITRKLNKSVSELEKYPIDEDLVETVSLAHDLGHPPFGHNGEAALDEMMFDAGGFEGNAQTLRILARLEKKVTSDRPDYIGITLTGEDKRYGLDLTMRTLASVLKYDREIPEYREEGANVVKGYYGAESELVKKIKKAVVGDENYPNFKTVECQIMDVSDDIAYSTYDLEDAFKAGFLTPLDLVSAKDDLLRIVKKEVNEKDGHTLSLDETRSILLDIFSGMYNIDVSSLNEMCKDDGEISEWDYLEKLSQSYQTSKQIAEVGYLRTQLTSNLVNQFTEGVRFKYNRRHPSQSEVYLEPDVKKKVDVLKRFAYVSLIVSPLLAAAKIRGKEIVKEIFDRLLDSKGEGHHLLPGDFREWYERVGIEEKQVEKRIQKQKRVICDFIAGMTDRYAAEFYFRIKSENPATIFKPL